VHKNKMKKVAILIMIFAILISPLSFAESEEDDGGFIGKQLAELLKWAPNAIGDGLNGFGPSAEEIYMPGSPYYFNFSTDNVFGLFTSRAYPLFKLIAIIMISPLLSFYGIGLMKASSGIGRKTSLDAIVTLVLSVGVLWFLPDILNFIFSMKDGVAEGVNQIFVSGDNTGFVEEMRQISEDGGILDALIFLASVVFSYWLMANYVGLSFGFAVLLLYTPVAIIISSASNMRKISGELNKTLWGYVLTPIFDISLLGIVTITRGVDPSAFGIEPLMYNIMSIVLVMSVIPARSFIKRLFGFGPMFGDMLGVGMIAGVAGMALRGAGGKGKSRSTGGSGNENRGRDELDNSGKAAYYDDLAQMEKQAQNPGTEVGFYDPANENLPPLKEMTREDFLQKHQGQSYFNERDIGGLSNKEKADFYKSQSNLDELKMRQDRKDRIKSGALGAGKSGFKGYTSVVGASAGMFMGPAAAVAGGMIGHKVGDKIVNSGESIKKVVSWGKDVYDESKDVMRDSDFASKINFRRFKTSEEGDSLAGGIDEQTFEDAIKVHVMNMEEEKGPGLSRPHHTLDFVFKFDKEAEKIKNESNTFVNNLMNDLTTEYSSRAFEGAMENADDYNSFSEKLRETTVRVEKFSRGARQIATEFSEANESITRDYKFEVIDGYYQNDNVIDREHKEARNDVAVSKREKAILKITEDVSKETGIDYKAYIIEHLSNMN